MRWDNIPNGVSILPSVGLRREGDPLRFNFDIAYRIFPAARRNYTSDVFSSTASWQILTLYHDYRDIFYMGDGLRAKCPF